MSADIRSVVAEHRRKFNVQRATQCIPGNTCPLIDAIQVQVLENGKKSEIVRRLEDVREANHQLRLRGIDWYELCRDLLDDLEMTLKLQVKKRKDQFSRTCLLPSCGRPISDRNKSGVCTHCWHERPDETADVWQAKNQERAAA